MITILKIGGSLLESDAAARLMREIAAARPRGLLIVPGGGAFADAVRTVQKQHALDDVLLGPLDGLGSHGLGGGETVALELVGRELAEASHEGADFGFEHAVGCGFAVNCQGHADHSTVLGLKPGRWGSPLKRAGEDGGGGFVPRP